ncbi:MAG: NUDIX domain-containing protein [Rhodospirillaceae bacterium]|nr:NUDIX domain-containing protein [Rhodospirillaceae bacterium]
MRAFLGTLYRLIPRPITRALLWAVNAKFNFGAVGLFLTADHRLLVLKHVYRHTYPWGLPGGYLKRGETAEAGILRELAEETGFTATIERVLSVEDVDAYQREAVFVGRIDPAQSPRLNHEIFEIAFVELDQLPTGMLPRHAALAKRLQTSGPLKDGPPFSRG